MRDLSQSFSLYEENEALLEAVEHMDSIMDQSKKDSFFILCLQAAFIDKQHNNLQELEYLLVDFLEEDHEQIHKYHALGYSIAESLTAKQLEIVTLLFGGNINQSEIAIYLGISKATVSIHLDRARTKINKSINIDWSLI